MPDKQRKTNKWSKCLVKYLKYQIKRQKIRWNECLVSFTIGYFVKALKKISFTMHCWKGKNSGD